MLDVEFDKAAGVRPSFAIEFNQNFVRIMQFKERSSNDYRLRSFAEVALSEGAIKDGVIVDIDTVSQALVKAIETAKPWAPNTSYAICTLPQNHTFFLTIDLPGVSKEELRGIIVRKAKDVFPMAESEIYWDWHRIITTESKTVVQLAAIERKIVDSYLKVLNKAKVVPLLFEPSALAAARLIARVDDKAAQGSILLELAPKGYVISVIKASEVVFSVEMTLPSLSPKENVRVLIRKIDEVVRYILAGEYDSTNTPIFVYGETAYLNEVMLEFSEQKVSNVINLNYGIKGDDSSHRLYRKNKEAYISLIGAGMMGLADDKKQVGRINLVPQVAKEAFRVKELSRTLRSYLTFITVNVMLLVLLVAVASIGVANSARTQEERYAAVVNFSKSERSKEIEAEINKLNNVSTQTSQLIASLYDWQKVLDLLREVTPEKITIGNVSMLPVAQAGVAELDFQLSGVAQDRISVIQMVEKLRQSSLLTEVKLPLESLEEGTNVNFTIEAKLPFKSLLNATDELK